MKTKIITLFLMLILSMGTMFASTRIGNLCYKLDATNLTAEVTSSYDKYSGDIVIPENVLYNATTYRVTSIGDSAFLYCSSLTSVTIPNSVTSIGEDAFIGCTRLTSVPIPNSVASIGEGAFRGCTRLTSVTIPNSVASIGEGAFRGCTGLTSVTIPNSVTSIGEYAFSSCTSLTSVTIPNSVISIGSYAFQYCKGLTSLTIPNSVTSIGNYAFQYCTSLTRIKISDSVTSIIEGAFSDCTSLTSVTIPNSVTSIGDFVFKNCSGLPSINIGHNVSNISSTAFSGCNNLITVTINSNILVSADKANLGSFFGAQVTRYVLGDSVKLIGAEAFRDCSNMSSIVIPDGVISIGNKAFYNCSRLKSISIPSTITSIGQGAFYGCTNLSNIVLPTSVQSIESETFRNCSNLRNISIPNSITNIGNLAFEGCSKLQNISISANVTNIGWSAFCDCTSLTTIDVSADNSNYCSIEGVLFNKDVSVLIQYPAGKQDSSYIVPNTVDTIGVSSFSSCEKLSSITIAVGVKSIETNAFLNCINLCSIDIPSTVNRISGINGCSKLTMVSINSNDIVGKDYTNSGLTNIFGNQVKTYVLGRDINKIGKKVFRSCSNLTSINIPTNVTIIGDSAFHYCRSLCDLDLSNSSISSIGEGAFYGCQSLLSLRIPNSITSLGKYAFFGCNKLDTIYCESIAPPSIGNYSFPTGSTLKAICVPCEAAENYLAAEGWASYASIISYQQSPYVINCLVKDTIGGIVTLPTVLTICENQIEAVPNYGYHFVQWSDGNTDNPRTIVLTQDTTFTAEFAVDKSGTCGENNALAWTYDDQSKTLTITGNGSLIENYTFGVEAPTQMNTLIIGDGITEIGDSAFYGMTTINHLFIGANVASIGNYAFAECRNFDDITCYATIVPTINSTTFANVGNKQYIYLFVPEDRERAYKRDVNWGEFDIQIKAAEEIIIDGGVAVFPTDNSVEISWPSVNNAETYEIVISKDGEVVCTLIFNANGQLTGIAFAPSRNNTQQAQTAGFRFTVTGLTSNTNYGYSITSKDAGDSTIDTKTGTFKTTLDGQSTVDLEDVLSTEKVTKILHNGQILILRGDKTCTLTSQEVK